jgi:hypothetical protein
MADVPEEAVPLGSGVGLDSASLGVGCSEGTEDGEGSAVVGSTVGSAVGSAVSDGSIVGNSTEGVEIPSVGNEMEGEPVIAGRLGSDPDTRLAIASLA